MEQILFKEFTKIPRLSRDCIVTEKIDGTNACIYIGENGDFFVGSRKRWITPNDDNYNFAKWAYMHKDELMQLGPGYHYGEWWGEGIQRKYGLNEKRFSLFNVSRWGELRPACCHIVPVLYRGIFNTSEIDIVLNKLKLSGSVASPGFMKPEGIVIYHIPGNTMFKKTIEKDDVPKSQQSMW